MKKLLILVATLLVNLVVFAPPISPVPQKINYQAVVRNSSNALVSNHAVGMMISILQGSATTGAVVYAETQTPTTNANGVLNIAIGTGTVSSGSFSAIDWSAGPYFTKIEIDPAGGTTYSIASISELLSVPYALHAKTADQVTGSGSSGHYVGELFGGGVVCWVDNTGQHGRIVSMVDLTTTGQMWSDGTLTLGITNNWDGAANTAAIIGQSGHTTSAAKLCADYTNADYGTGIYSDWYLPAIAEMNYVFENIFEIQKPLTLDGNPATSPLFDPATDILLEDNPNDTFSSSSYWSSSLLNIKLNDGGEYYLAYSIYFDAFGEEDRGISMAFVVPTNPYYNSLLNVRAMRTF